MGTLPNGKLRSNMLRINEIPGYSCGLRALRLAPVLSLAASLTAQMPGQKAPGPPPEQVEQTAHGIRATAGNEVLQLTVCTDSVIHVVATPEPSAPASRDLQPRARQSLLRHGCRRIAPE